jgi:hypothetical protein
VHLKSGTSSDPPRPSREQLRNVLAAALGNCRSAEPRPLSTYEPLGWLLCDDIGNQVVRGARRSLYRKLVRDLATEFHRIYGERLVASNGPWEFSDVYVAADQARKCIRRMRWCAFAHLCHLPSASAGSVEAYRSMMELLTRAADPSIA